MPGPYDSTTRYLVETFPRDWLRLLGIRVTGPVELVDTNLATVTMEADKVLRLEEPTPHLVHLELQASRDARMGHRLARYNMLLSYAHDVPVLTALILLRPEAESPGMNGRWTSISPGGAGVMEFRYPVVRVWTLPVEQLLAAPLGLLPLATLSDEAQPVLPDVLRTVKRRFESEAGDAQARALSVVTFILLGLRQPRALVQQLFPEVLRMRESSTYQLILDEGRAEGQAIGQAIGRAAEAREVILLLGTDRFGPPTQEQRSLVEQLQAVDELERLVRRILHVSSWDELFRRPSAS